MKPYTIITLLLMGIALIPHLFIDHVCPMSNTLAVLAIIATLNGMIYLIVMWNKHV